MKQQEISKALNELLKNSKISIELFETLKTHLSSEQLVREVNEFLFEFHTHKKSLEGLIVLFHGEVEDLKMMDIMNEYIEKLKQMMIQNDHQVLTYALNYMNEQLDHVKMFVNTYDLDYDHIRKTIAIMYEDYQMMIHKLKKYQILFA